MRASARFSFVFPGIRTGVAIALAIGGNGCVTSETGPPVPTPTESKVALVAPAAGDTVQGIVDLLASVESVEALIGLVFYVDGMPIDTVTTPPWETAWSSEAPEQGASRRLHVEADTGCRRVRSADVTVWVLRDLPPVVTLDSPPRVRWIEQVPEARLRARASDPEDGALSPERIRWRGDRLDRTISGEWLPLEILPEADQIVIAEATDRWGRSGSTSIRLRPFRYRSPGTPEDLVANLAAALSALEPNRVVAACAAGFEFVPCGPVSDSGQVARWALDQFADRLSRWMGDAALSQVSWEWDVGRAARWQDGSERRAWVPCTGITLRFRREQDEVELRGGGARLLFGAATEAAPWALLRWNDDPNPGGLELETLLSQSGARAWAARSRPN